MGVDVRAQLFKGRKAGHGESLGLAGACMDAKARARSRLLRRQFLPSHSSWVILTTYPFVNGLGMLAPVVMLMAVRPSNVGWVVTSRPEGTAA